jgi:hypothetical protein
MSTQVETAFVNQYNANIQLLSQQPHSRLGNCVRRETQQGEYQFFDQIGSVTMTELTGRHADTTLQNTPHARRRVGLTPYTFADMIDWKDRAQMLTDPQSPYAVNAVMAAGRQIDTTIIAAATGDAYTDKTGSTAVSLPDTQKIAHGSTGLTVAKLRTAKKILDQNEAGMMGNDSRFIAVTAQQIDDLLGTTEATSADYNSVRALVSGDIDTFLGFKFIRLELLSITSDIRTCFAWVKDGILLSTAEEIQVEVDRRKDKNYGVQVYVKQMLGATRMEEKKVVEIACAEA